MQASLSKKGALSSGKRLLMRKKETNPEDAAIGKRIAQLRKEHLGIESQQVFAKRLGNVTRGAVGNWELGKGIKRENLQRIANVFEVSFDWLATGRGTIQPAQDDTAPSEDEFRRLWLGADDDVKRSALILLRGGQKPSKD